MLGIFQSVECYVWSTFNLFHPKKMWSLGTSHAGLTVLSDTKPLQLVMIRGCSISSAIACVLTLRPFAGFCFLGWMLRLFEV